MLKNKNWLVFLITLIAVLVLGVFFINDKQGSTEISETPVEKTLVPNDLNSQELSIEEAIQIAKEEALQWRKDAIFNRAEGKKISDEGTSRTWKVHYSSQEANRTVIIEIQDGEIVNKYEGIGKDISNFESNLDQKNIKGEKIVELALTQEETKDYLDLYKGILEKELILLEKEELPHLKKGKVFEDVPEKVELCYLFSISSEEVEEEIIFLFDANNAVIIDKK